MRDRSPVAVVVGRFQPFHNGHLGLLERAGELGDRVVVVLGSSGSAPSPRNPFSASEREAMIREASGAGLSGRISFVRQRDVWDTDRWAREVRSRVERAHPGEVRLVGFHKDATSAYLDRFPGWTVVDAGRQGKWDATPIRERILSADRWEDVRGDLRGDLPEPVLHWLDAWAISGKRQALAREVAETEGCRSLLGAGPFLSVGVVARCSGRILLVRRGHSPGLGLLSLPSGFLGRSEVLLEGARRVLREAAGIDLATEALPESRWFDHPGRSLRGRILECVFRFELGDRPLPQDGTGTIAWLDPGEIREREEDFFEDHFHILDSFLELVERP